MKYLKKMHTGCLKRWQCGQVSSWGVAGAMSGECDSFCHQVTCESRDGGQFGAPAMTSATWPHGSVRSDGLGPSSSGVPSRAGGLKPGPEAFLTGEGGGASGAVGVEVGAADHPTRHRT